MVIGYSRVKKKVGIQMETRDDAFGSHDSKLVPRSLRLKPWGVSRFQINKMSG